MFSNRTRVTGLSGFDTEGMVQQLMKAESIKYTNMLKRATLITYKQDAYRGVSKTLSDFQKEFLGVTSNVVNSMRLPSTFKSLTAKVTSGGNATGEIGVSVSSSAKSGSYGLSVYQIARKDQYTGNVAFGPSVSGSIDFKGLVYTARESYEEEEIGEDGQPVTVTKEREVQKLVKSINVGVSLDGASSKSISFTDAELENYFQITSETNMVDGEEVTTYKAEFKDAAARQAFQDKLNEKLNTTFGTDSLQGNKQKIEAAVGSDGSVTFKTLPGHTATFSGDSKAFGIASGKSTVNDLSVTLGSLFNKPGDFNADGEIAFSINGVDFAFSETDTLETVMNKINEDVPGVKFSLNQNTGALVLESTGVGASNAIRFEGKGSNAAQVEDAFSRLFNRTSTAQDAIISTDGGRTQTTRATNTFTIDGITYSLNENSTNKTATGADDVSKPKVFEVNVTSEVTNVKNAILKFVEEYNKLVSSLNGLLVTSRPKSATGDYYEPLTDEEKGAMTETQIKAWEEKAKQGMLYRDPIIEKTLTTMRSQMTGYLTLDDGRKISLSSIGITVSEKWGDGGTLVVDEGALTKALEERPDDVEALFTKSPASGSKRGSAERYRSEGLGERLNDIIELAIGFNGTLDKKAGTENTSSDKNNDMYKELQAHNEKITQMLTYLQNKEDYYYRMFSKMEAAMMEAESQMASLQGLMGS